MKYLNLTFAALIGFNSVAGCSPTMAQTLAACRSVANPQARLACYDGLPVAIPSAATPPDAASVPKAAGLSFTYSWSGVLGCRTITKAPAFKFSNIPANSRRVSLVLTQGEREYGGQEVALPENGLVPEGAVTVVAPCVPGLYRWTAIIKSETGVILATVRSDRWYPD